MKVIFLIWWFVKLITCITERRHDLVQQSSFLRVLKNKLFKHSNVIKHNEVHITKCLAICNLEEGRCGSVNYNDGTKTCVVHIDVDEDSTNDDEMMIDSNGWTYYEKDKEIKSNLVSEIKIIFKQELCFLLHLAIIESIPTLIKYTRLLTILNLTLIC